MVLSILYNKMVGSPNIFEFLGLNAKYFSAGSSYGENALTPSSQKKMYSSTSTTGSENQVMVIYSSSKLM